MPTPDETPMFRARRPLLGALLALAASACRSGPPPLPFDAAPAMHAVREDAAEIARRLDRGELLDAVRPAHRLSTLRIAPGHLAPPDFRALEGELREAATTLVEALEAGSAPRARRAFERTLDRCDACHARYRPDP